MKGHTANIEAWPALLIDQQRLGPILSTSLPMGYAAMNPAMPAIVSPSPT